MSDVIKIAIVGDGEAGKTVGFHLAVNHAFESPYAFGNVPKRYAQEIFITDSPELHRFIETMREYDPDVWIKHVERSVEYALDRKSTTGIVITDARQANEIAWCKANGFSIVRVTAPDDVRIARAQAVGDVFDYEALTHPTETEVDGFEADYVLENDGDYASLIVKVDALMAEIRKGAI